MSHRRTPLTPSKIASPGAGEAPLHLDAGTCPVVTDHEHSSPRRRCHGAPRRKAPPCRILQTHLWATIFRSAAGRMLRLPLFRFTRRVHGVGQIVTAAAGGLPALGPLHGQDESGADAHTGSARASHLAHGPRHAGDRAPHLKRPLIPGRSAPMSPGGLIPGTAQ